MPVDTTVTTEVIAPIISSSPDSIDTTGDTTTTTHDMPVTLPTSMVIVPLLAIVVFLLFKVIVILYFIFFTFVKMAGSTKTIEEQNDKKVKSNVEKLTMDIKAHL